MPSELSQPRRPSIARDVASAYLASIAKISGFIIISGLVARYLGHSAFAVLALVRGTIGLFGYIAAGLNPAVVRAMAEADGAPPPQPAPVEVEVGTPAEPSTLHYWSPPAMRRAAQVVYSNAAAIVWIIGLLGLAVLLVYAGLFTRIHRIPPGLSAAECARLALAMGAGLILRLISEPAGAVLQTRGRIATDNLLITLGEVVWVSATASLLLVPGWWTRLWSVGGAYLLSGLVLLVLRTALAQREVLLPQPSMLSAATVRRLLAFAGLVTLGQIADFLYAPADYIIINRWIRADAVADFAPAVQIASGLLLLVSGIAAVLLPRSAVAHASGNLRQVRRYYIHGTLLSVALLALAAAAVQIASGPILRAWLGRPMPVTQQILPLILAAAVLGGSGAVGASILLAMGRTRAYTLSLVLAGILNVTASATLALGLHMGLQGIVIAAIIAVGLRSAVWTPWYLLRALKHSADHA